MKKQSIFLIFAIVLTSCTSLAGNTQSPSPSATETTWNKYTNETVGFSVQYPPNWQQEDLPDENNGQLHHIALKGPEGGVELIWGTGLGGACPEGYQPLAITKGSISACHTQREDGTDLWSLAGQQIGNTDFSGFLYTNDTTSTSRAVVLKVISTLRFP